MDYAKFLINDTYTVSHVIYRFKNKVNGKVYIGQTIKPLRKRVIQHVTCSNPNTKCHKSYFHRALNKYGIENFELNILEICSCQKELDERERYWIAHYKSTDKRFGYNIDSGGSKGKKTKGLTEDHKEKLLEANLGRHRSENTKQRIRNTHRQMWQDPEYRKKHIDNIMKIAGINRKSIYQYDTDGNFIKEWESTYAVCEHLYGARRKGSLIRNIKNNLKRNKLGFMKNGYIWTTVAPSERRAY